MKDLIFDRLNRISDLNERKILKTVLYDVYENLVDYNLDMYNKLERRIYEEIEDVMNKLYIYTTVDYIQNIDYISDFFHPVLQSDLEEQVFDLNEINEKLIRHEDVVITCVFMKCSYMTIREILKKNKIYKGYIKTDKDIYEIGIYLRQSKKYVDEFGKLYKCFQNNTISWSTINCAYAYKFLDVILKSDINIDPSESIKEIVLDLGEYERYKVINVVLLWNIKNINVQDKSFPLPAKDRINFEHMVSLIELGIKNGYIVGSDNIPFLYTKYIDNDIVIVSEYDQQHKWNLVQFEDISNNVKKNFEFQVLSNKRNLSFSGRYVSLKGIIIRTKAEIARLLQSYAISKELVFQDIEIKEEYNKIVQTFDLNSFIEDNIRIDKYKKIMIIKFRPVNREDFMVLDKMSFLVSEIQIVFCEYKCIGELV